MRTLRQAEKSLHGTVDKSSIDSALSRMRVAQTGLREMADVLERAIRRGRADLQLFDSDQPLAVQVQRIFESLKAKANPLRVEMIVQISSAAGRLRGSTLGGVILNTMRNAIEACATVRDVQRRVEFSATISSRNELVILVSDNGPGIASNFAFGQSTKRTGHGIGLEVSRQIVADLGGRFELVSVPGNTGTVVRVVIPVTSLEPA